MLNKLSVLVAAALLMSACQQPEPAVAPPPPAPPPTGKGFLVFFDWDSTRLSAQALDTLRQAAAAAKASGSTGVTATGHADRSGSDNYNMALSLRRANAVKLALGRDGVPAAAVTTVGRGETQPLVQTADGVREPQNRRVEVVIGGQVAMSGDAAYCREMSVRYRRYLGQASTEGDVAKAIYDCESGNTAAGIPVLEKALRDAKLALPPRA